METLLIIFFMIFCLYIIYISDKKEQERIHKSYIKILNQLKTINEEYLRGEYDFETYKQKKESLYKGYNIPLDYKEELE